MLAAAGQIARAGCLCPLHIVLHREVRPRPMLVCQAKRGNAADVLLRKMRGKCSGCGIRLQADDSQRVGYTSPQLLQSSQAMASQVHCERCLALQQGAMVAGVKDHYQGAVRDAQQAAWQLVTPEQLRRQLQVVQGRYCTVVLLLDLLDAQATLLGSLRSLVGSNPVVLVATKADLLPAGARPASLAAWLRQLATNKRLKLTGVHVVSSTTGQGLSQCLAAIMQERRGRDLFVMGAANVGKTAFVQALLESAQQAGQLAAATGLPLQSGMPGTTLGMLPVASFSSGGLLYDTPGLHLPHRALHLLSPPSLAVLQPTEPLQPHLTPCIAELVAGAGAAGGGAGGSAPAAPGSAGAASGAGQHHQEQPQGLCSYQWGGLAQIEVLQAPASLLLVFYSPPALLPVRCTPGPLAVQQAAASPEDAVLTLSDATPWRQQGGSSSSSSAAGRQLFASSEVQLRGGLVSHKELRLAATGAWSALGDVCIAGLPGWVSVYAPGARGAVVLSVRAPRGVGVLLRPAMPLHGALDRQVLAQRVEGALRQEAAAQQQRARGQQQQQRQQQQQQRQRQQQGGLPASTGMVQVAQAAQPAARAPLVQAPGRALLHWGRRHVHEGVGPSAEPAADEPGSGSTSTLGEASELAAPHAAVAESSTAAVRRPRRVLSRSKSRPVLDALH